MDAVAASASAAVVLAFVHGLARYFEHGLSGVPRSRWLSVAGGTSVAYVLVHLLPEIAQAQSEIDDDGLLLAALERELWIAALAGLVVFYGLERSAASRDSAWNDGAVDASGWVHLASYAFYNAIAGYLLLERASAGVLELSLYTVAIALHFIVNDNALVEDHGDLYRRRGRWLLAGAVLGGWAIGVAEPLHRAVVPLVTAFLGGGIILNVLKEELPEERQSRFGSFAAAAAAYGALLLVV